MKKLICFIFLTALLPFPASAGNYFFNPNLIISNEEFRDYNSMSQIEIQAFLEEKNSPLARLSFADYQGINKKASEIIWQAAQEGQISPKVLLTTLQKEQSLIENLFATQTQFDRAMGYRCFDNAICNPKSLGFGKQVDGAAWQFQQYYENPGNWNIKNGVTAKIDDYLITPENQATANLYNYTPHYSGNRSFFDIWQKYWGLDYPDGSLVKPRGASSVWLIQYGQRRPIASYGVLLSRFNPKQILPISKSDLEKYELGSMIKFRNYSLLRVPTGKIYLVANDELRQIVSPEVFRRIGFSWEEVEEVQESDLAGYKIGANLTEKSVYPTGTLLQAVGDKDIYYVENGIKHWVPTEAILEANFPGKVVTKVSVNELADLPLGEKIKFKEGQLIKSGGDKKVYVVSNGYRRLFLNAQIFEKLGYQWHNIITADPNSVESMPLGEYLK